MSYDQYEAKQREQRQEEVEREELRRRLPKGAVALEKVVMD